MQPGVPGHRSTATSPPKMTEISSRTSTLGALRRWSAAMLLLACTSAFAQAPAPSAAWDAYVRRFIETQFAANPVFAVYMGRHEFDGRLPDLSKAALERNVATLEQARKDAGAFDPATLDE